MHRLFSYGKIEFNSESREESAVLGSLEVFELFRSMENKVVREKTLYTRQFLHILQTNQFSIYYCVLMVFVQYIVRVFMGDFNY